jgi:hypothetical protein
MSKELFKKLNEAANTDEKTGYSFAEFVQGAIITGCVGYLFMQVLRCLL